MFVTLVLFFTNRQLSLGGYETSEWLRHWSDIPDSVAHFHITSPDPSDEDIHTMLTEADWSHDASLEPDTLHRLSFFQRKYDELNELLQKIALRKEPVQTLRIDTILQVDASLLEDVFVQQPSIEQIHLFDVRSDDFTILDLARKHLPRLKVFESNARSSAVKAIESVLAITKDMPELTMVLMKNISLKSNVSYRAACMLREHRSLQHFIVGNDIDSTILGCMYHLYSKYPYEVPFNMAIAERNMRLLNLKCFQFSVARYMERRENWKHLVCMK